MHPKTRGAAKAVDHDRSRRAGSAVVKAQPSARVAKRGAMEAGVPTARRSTGGAGLGRCARELRLDAFRRAGTMRRVFARRDQIEEMLNRPFELILIAPVFTNGAISVELRNVKSV